MEKCSLKELKAISPISMVTKRNKTWRLIFDGRHINKCFASPPMSLVSCMAPLHRPKKYSIKIDFSNAFMHFEMRENFRNWFGFQVDGQGYRFRAMPFGWCNSPALCEEFFRPVIQEIRRKYPEVMSYIYIDDSIYCHDDPKYLKKVG